VAPAGGSDPRAALLKLLPAGSKIEDLKPAPIPGLYEFTQGAEVSYLTADGKYFLDGNIYDMASRQNLTESVRTQLRAKLLGTVPESQMVIFSPKNPLYTISVFTDIDCPYCRKLHSDMAELNKLGVRVRYLFFPRTGPNTESWRKAEVVWCSADRNDAFTRAKAGATLDMNKTCAATPVAREYALGQSLGVRGTPTIITESGAFIDGYMPPHDLVKAIKERQVASR
jgi:thiol:disulfide interchange protein DsbC